MQSQHASSSHAAPSATTSATGGTSLLDVVVNEYSKHAEQRTSRALIMGEIVTGAQALVQFHEDFVAAFARLEEQQRALAAQDEQLADAGFMHDDEHSHVTADARSSPSSSVSRSRRTSERFDEAPDAPQKVQPVVPSGQISGVLVTLDGRCFVHVMEAPTKTIMAMLRALRKLEGGSEDGDDESDEAFASSGLANVRAQNIRVASFTEEVVREFHVWAPRSAQLGPEGEVSVGDLLQDVFGTYKQLLELARAVRHERSRAVEVLQSNRQFVMAKLPHFDRIQAYCQSDEMCTAGEYLEVYDKDVEVVLDSESVWPPPAFLNF